MHVAEAQWINSYLGRFSARELSPLLNVGSSTESFRTIQQPHIEELLLRPLRSRGIEVVNQDIKDAAGVDLVGDLTDPNFAASLAKLEIGTLLCNNLLEHVPQRSAIVDALLAATPRGSVIVATGPSRYPKHLDPIDTMFRPSPGELAALFHTTKVEEMAELDVGSVVSGYSNDALGLVRLLLLAGMPFGGFPRWVTAVHKVAWLFRVRKLYCVAMRKI